MVEPMLGPDKMFLFKNIGSKGVLSSGRFTTALFWGAIWGLSEATLGHSLHLLRIPGLAGLVMFPAGIFFMLKAYQNTKSYCVIFSSAVIAAGIKLSNLWLPGTFAIDVLKPAMAIMAESLAVLVLLSIVENRALQRHIIFQ